MPATERSLEKQKHNRNVRGRADALVLCPRPVTALRLSVQTHPANGPGMTQPSRPGTPLPADSAESMQAGF